MSAWETHQEYVLEMHLQIETTELREMKYRASAKE